MLYLVFDLGIVIKGLHRMSFSEYGIRLKGSKNKFFSAINATIDWAPMEKDINKVYKKGRSATGRSSYSGLLLFKMMLIQTWYNLSNTGVEEMLGNSRSAMHFCDLTLEDDVPDHSTLSRFRSESIQKKGLKRVLRKVNRQLEKKGLKLKEGAARVDATITQSDRRPKGPKQWETLATNDRQEAEETDKKKQQDREVKIVVKRHPGVDIEARWTKKRGKLYYGYKRSIAVNDDRLIESAHTTTANVHDNQALEPLIKKTGKKKLKGGIYADKGYCGWYYDEMLIHYNIKNRIQKKAARGRPLTRWERLYNKLISKKRWAVKRSFGSMVRWFGAGHTRYAGLAKTHGQHVMEAIAHNLYRLVGQVHQYHT